MEQPNPIQRVAQFVRSWANASPPIRRVVLFGSRARGDFKEKSDYDIAVWADPLPHDRKAVLASNLEEDIPTLCHVDLVWVDDCHNQALLDKIRQEGVVWYDRDPTTQAPKS